MDRTTTRAWRRIQKKRVWRNRLRLFLCVLAVKHIEAESWKDLRAAKWCQVYRTTGRPCSCVICSGERYNRIAFKREAAKDIQEQLESKWASNLSAVSCFKRDAAACLILTRRCIFYPLRGLFGRIWSSFKIIEKLVFGNDVSALANNFAGGKRRCVVSTETNW